MYTLIRGANQCKSRFLLRTGREIVTLCGKAESDQWFQNEGGDSPVGGAVPIGNTASYMSRRWLVTNTGLTLND